MYRFLLWVWNASDTQQCSVAADLEHRVRNSPRPWQQVMSAPGLLVLSSQNSSLEGGCRALSDGCGVVLGHLFRKSLDGSPSDAPQTLTPVESGKIVGSEGLHLMTHFWGRYLAVIRHPDNGCVLVIRDPSGTLPCFVTSHRNTYLVFSDIQDYVGMGLARCSLDWELLNLVAAGMSRRQDGNTALVGIQELRAGECLRLAGSTATRRFCWNPVNFARENPIESFDEAAKALRDTVRSCVQTWASLFSHIVLSLSGGLDSSIVLSALVGTRRRPTLTALNLYTQTREGDERSLARKAADHMRVPLVQRQLDSNTAALGELGQIALSPFPDLGCTTELLTGPIEKALAEQVGAEALFSGVGGDGIFLQTGARWSTADYIRTRGIRWSLLRVAHDGARMTSESMWTLLWWGIALRWRETMGPEAAGFGTSPGPGIAFAGSSQRSRELPFSFLSADVIEHAISRSRETSRLPYPEADGLPPGKQWHIRASCFPGYYYRPFASLDRPQGIFPLVSQPIHELCLRIPLYVMFRGGLDRAVARAAFAADVPREIIYRTFKGQSNQVNRDMLDTNLAFVREYLLEGTLAGQKLIDVRKLERFLAGERPGGMAEIMGCNQIMARLLPVEAFARRWVS